jgi:hypothetical protein
MSPRELGRTPRADASPQELEIFDGCSVWDALASVRAVATRPGGIALIEVRESESLRYRKTFGKHHYTVWGDPDDLLAAVIDVLPL